jgi:hypothetical protein
MEKKRKQNPPLTKSPDNQRYKIPCPRPNQLERVNARRNEEEDDEYYSRDEGWVVAIIFPFYGVGVCAIAPIAGHLAKFLLG